MSSWPSDEENGRHGDEPRDEWRDDKTDDRPPRGNDDADPARDSDDVNTNDQLESPGNQRETLDELNAGATIGSPLTPGAPPAPGAVIPHTIDPPPSDNGAPERKWRWEGPDRRNSAATMLAVAAVVGAVIGSMLTMMLFPTLRSYLSPKPQLPAPSGPNLTQTALPNTNQEPAVFVSQRVGPAVVTIVNRQSGATGGFGQSLQQNVTGGSGVIIDANGYIVTNNHVVAASAGLSVTLSDGRTLPAHVVGADPVTDLAVIKVDTVNLPTAEFGDSDKLQVGEAAIAIGNPVDPEAFVRTVTEGIISGVNRKVNQGDRIMTLLQTDAAINPGNSGGPLCNASGQVVGINVAKIAESQDVEGIGLAIPANVARPIINELISSGKIARVWIGTGLAEKDTAAAYYGVNVSQGLLVVKVYSGSPADKAGVQAGDILNKADGQPLDSAAALKTILDAKRPGQQMVLDLTRNGKAVSVTVTLVEQPADIGQ